MDNLAARYPLQRVAPFREWSPSVHYAQFQTLPPGPMPRRRLYDFELLYVAHGEAATYMHGQRYTLTAGQLIFLPSGVYHQNEIISTPEARFLGIHFDFFDELDVQTEADMVVYTEEAQGDKFAVEACAEHLASLSASIVYTPSLVCVQLMEQLVHEFTMRPPGYELACKAYMLQILTHLLRSSLSSSVAQASVHGDKLLEVMKQIEDAPAEPWTNPSLAKRLNLSVDHMAKLFKQIAGMPPSEFVQSIRHREARRLLRESGLSIESIGESVGYPDIHYFSRIFRRHEGISPREYRKLSNIL
ncbi:Cupin domain-containing protein [Paenibacillus algorifonticola]|uniref:Cupin domain-containing protein n=1 Tax=Paenibacillus algorifonticola TaxID=684063 RepID=A0A1I2HF49_9BACL|nr:AraC family transcriptional regulator [Paenibacillus algorifonticola]SFF27537.1 Cupin domain-containing protein [Paenibacillus algorifonticola]